MSKIYPILLLFVCSFAQAQTTVQDGDWSDPATWDVVPTGILGEEATVNHLVTITSPANSYNVTINCRLTQYTEFRFHTVWVQPDGEFIQLAGHKLIHRDFPPVRPDELDGGVICIGKWRAYGTPKTVRVRSECDMLAGDQTLTVDRSVNWQPGDEILLPHTRQLNTEEYIFYPDIEPFVEFENDAEMVTVIGVQGNVVQVTPLQYDHKGTPANPWGIQKYPHVVCKTRDSKWSSENPNNPGHVMITGRGDFRGSHIEIDNYGRTSGDGPVGDGNQIARYAVHWHLCLGPDPSLSVPWQGELVGCVISNPRKWSIDVHGSDYILIQDCTSWGANSGFVTENGTEQHNRFEYCVSMNPKVGWQTEDAGVFSDNDFGSEGSGFWYRSVGNDIVNCVSYGGTRAFSISGLFENQNYQDYSDGEWAAGGYRNWRIARGQPETVLAYSAPYVGKFDDNEAWGAWKGMYMLYPLRYPWLPEGVDAFRPFNNFQIFNCHKGGVFEYQSGHIIWNDLTILFNEEITNANLLNSSSSQLWRWRHTVGLSGGGSNSYGPIAGNVYNRPKVSGAVLGMANSPCNGFYRQLELSQPNSINDAEFATQYGILLVGGGTHSHGNRDTSIEINNFTWLPSGVDRRPNNWNLPYIPGPRMGIAVVPGDDGTQGEIPGFYDLQLDGRRLWSYRDVNAPPSTPLPNEEFPDVYGLIEND